MNVLLVNNTDYRGGSDGLARQLAARLRERGDNAWLAVGQKLGNDQEVFSVGRSPSLPASRLLAWAGLRSRGLVRLAGRLDDPCGRFKRYLGYEDFDFPKTYSLPNCAPQPPDLLHLHDLEAHYFDLRALPWLTRRLPTMLTIHNAWLLGGGCGHSFDCEKWKTGCGGCPQRAHLRFRLDGTHRNWMQKSRIYQRSRLFLAAPCRWIMEKAAASILQHAVVESRVIMNGVDLNTFQPGSQRQARAELGLPPDRKVLLFVATGMRHSIYKDYATLRQALTHLAPQLKLPLVLLAIGENAPNEIEDNLEIRFIPYLQNASRVALHYRAADLYVHSARAETFPIAVLEALACGRAVVASAVGGIIEQVRGLRLPQPFGDGWARLNTHPADTATGILVTPQDPAAMASAIGYLLRAPHETVLRRLSENAGRDARERFDLRKKLDTYMNWYDEIYATRRSASQED